MSRGLDKLKIIRHIHDMECGPDKSINKDFDIIEKELILCEALTAFFNIIIDDELRKDFINADYKNVDEEMKKHLSKEHFEAIKEMLKSHE